MPERREGEPVDREDTTNFRRRRRRTASVEGVKRCVGGSGCCATPLVSEVGAASLSTGSPFGHHPRLRMVCPRRGQWVSMREVLPLLLSRPLVKSLCVGLCPTPLTELLFLHPAVTHGVSPAGTVDRNCCFYYHSYQKKLEFCCHVVTAE